MRNSEDIFAQKGRVGPIVIRAFIQARMSSSRFPGKVLAPFRGKPLIKHVVERVNGLLPASNITVLTSSEESDDPLETYLERAGIHVFRGPLVNVFERFRLCLVEQPCDWILRISADSPLLSADVLRRVVQAPLESDCDLVTTIFPRTFPRGNNAELIRSSLLDIAPQELTADDREHVTPYYYRHSSQYRICNIVSGSPELAESNLAVDTVEDLRRLESLPFQGPTR